LQVSQRIIAISRDVAREIASEFAIPNDEIAVVYHGVEAAAFRKRAEGDPSIQRQLRLPGRYFFSVGADYPHKNLRGLLEAYALFRDRWRERDVPGLVLAGPSAACRNGIYPILETSEPEEGVLFLGTVSFDQLRVLYQNALALVFPSLYEGFGLTPLEAMAAGTPVIAMHISAVPEVVGDCACYCEGLSPRALAKAMEKLATDAAMREELRRRGLAHIEKFRWQDTALATYEVYRSAVLRPTERALRARHGLRAPVLAWANPDPVIGIRAAWRALDASVQARFQKELRRLRPAKRQHVSRKG
jgi:glycosyltransferase involved in cell wall biosynthesis